MDVCRKQLLGGYGQGETYRVTVPGVQGEFAGRACLVHNNAADAHPTLQAMLSEFVLAKDLSHPNILSYLYFIRKYNRSNKIHEFHSLLELANGCSSLDRFIQKRSKDAGSPTAENAAGAASLDQVRKLGT